jgi:hypothetical protein
MIRAELCEVQGRLFCGYKQQEQLERTVPSVKCQIIKLIIVKVEAINFFIKVFAQENCEILSCTETRYKSIEVAKNLPIIRDTQLCSPTIL